MWQNNLLKRCLSALVAIPLALLFYWWGGWPYRGLIFCLACLGCWELWFLLFPYAFFLRRLLLSFLLSICLLCLIFFVPTPFSIPIPIFCFITIAISLNLALLPPPRTGWVFLKIFLAQVYILLAFSSLLWLTQGHYRAFGCVILMIWATDSGGYIFGKAIAGPKLCPHLSPGKTWSGAWGGLLSGTFVGILSLHYAHPGFLDASLEIVSKLFSRPCWLCKGENWSIVSQAFLGYGSIAMMLLISLLAQGGDLLESALKRSARVKDSGFFMMGHGGVLDRLDGVMAVCVFLGLMGLLGLDNPFFLAMENR